MLSSSPTAALGQAQGASDQAQEASDQAESVALEAIRIPDNLSIDLDGRLDEEAWSLATPISDFTQQYPVEGGVPSERTEIRVVFNGDELFIGAILYDDPSGIVAYQKRRDAGLGTDDRFMWILDTFLDGRTGYFFEINAAGLMGDGLITGSGGGGRGGGGGGGRSGGRGGGGGMQKSWDGILGDASDPRARRMVRPRSGSRSGRLISIRTSIPGGSTFSGRFVGGRKRFCWRGYRRNQGVFQPIHAGRLTGLHDLSQGIGLEATPYAVGSWRTQPADVEPTTYPGDVGVDVSYSLTPSLRAALSANTDFAEVEVDQRRVNLTRFPLALS